MVMRGGKFRKSATFRVRPYDELLTSEVLMDSSGPVLYRFTFPGTEAPELFACFLILVSMAVRYFPDTERPAAQAVSRTPALAATRLEVRRPRHASSAPTFRAAWELEDRGAARSSAQRSGHKPRGTASQSTVPPCQWWPTVLAQHRSAAGGGHRSLRTFPDSGISRGMC